MEKQWRRNGGKGSGKGRYGKVLAVQPLVGFSCFKLLRCPKNQANDLLMPQGRSVMKCVSLAETEMDATKVLLLNIPPPLGCL